MKKLSLLLFIITFSFTVVLAGCSSTDKKVESTTTDQAPTVGQKAKEVKLSILSWNNEKEMKPLMEAFKKKYPNITFDFQTAPPVKDYIAKLQTMLLSNSATDIFVMAAENRNEIIDGGYALDLTDKPFMQTMLDRNKPMLSKNGKTYAFTQTGWVGGIYYNKKLFKKAGIDTEPQTWDEFIKDCLKLKAAGILPFYTNFQDISTIQTGLYANTTLSKDPDFDKKIFAGEKTFEEGWTPTLKLMKEGLIDNKIITADMLGLSGDQIVNEFATEKVAMFEGGPWNISAIQTANPNIEFSMMAVPGVNADGGNYFAGAPGVGLAINSKTKYQDEALQFLEFTASAEGLKAFEDGSHAIITAKGYESKVNPVMETAYKEGLLKGKFYLPMVDWPRDQEALRNQFVVSLQNMAIGKMTPEEVAKSLDKKFKEVENK